MLNSFLNKTESKCDNVKLVGCIRKTFYEEDVNDQIRYIIAGNEYTYRIDQICNFKDFFLYKEYLFLKGNGLFRGKDKIYMYDVCPVIYTYINRYIIYGAKLNLSHLTKTLNCSSDIIYKDVCLKHGFDENIFNDESESISMLDARKMKNKSRK